MITPRNARHSYLRSLAVQWLRKNKPVIYRLLRKKAAEKYPSNGQGGSDGKVQ